MREKEIGYGRTVVFGDESLLLEARAIRDEVAGKKVNFRAVIEFTNLCHRNCLYCGMRALNKHLSRYTLNTDDILAGARSASDDGIKTVMIQGGDHLKYDVTELCETVHTIHHNFKQTVLLCIGDRPVEDYKALYSAGAKQAIIKFETSNEKIYKAMRPHNTLKSRLDMLYELSQIGYQISSGFILGLPGTTQDDVERDLNLLSKLPLFAASVSPFIANDQSPLSKASMPSLCETLNCIAQIRIQSPELRIPAVSALNLLPKDERYKEPAQLLGLMAGANVLTVNYTPKPQRASYVIYRSRGHVVELEHANRVATLAGLRIA